MGANPLPGTWRLVRWDIVYGDGRPASHPFGEDATGLLHYTDDGGMTACIARAGRRPLSSASTRSAPPEEQQAAFQSYFHYAGTYRIEERDGRRRVVHSVSHSLNPGFVGTEQARDMELDEDGTLTLSGSDTVPGSEVSRLHRLVWRR